jgi:hypothetical protein
VLEAVRMVRGDWVRFGNVRYSSHLAIQWIPYDTIAPISHWCGSNLRYKIVPALLEDNISHMNLARVHNLT